MSNTKEYQAILFLALVMAVRMIGLFMILPVFSLHAGEYMHADAQWIGLALGIYGLTQAILQIPFGMLSDRIGRKPVMTLGLALFVIGSLCAAVSHTIYGLILGRALQGAGAIGSTILALTADLTRDENRSRAMAIMGLAIGSSFALAMILGPLLDAWAGLSGIFWLSAVLAIFAEILVWKWVPAPPIFLGRERVKWSQNLTRVLKDAHLWRLDAGIFFLHAILTSLFIIMPIVLGQSLQLTSKEQTAVYLVALVLAFLLMLPVLIFAEKKQQIKPVFLLAIVILGVVLLLLNLLPLHSFSTVLILVVFFAAFTLLEAILPSWISKVAPLQWKGAAMGIYSSAQFLGIFSGGFGGGWLYSHFGASGIYWGGITLSLAWLIISYGLKPAPAMSTEIFSLDQFQEKNNDKLTQELYGIAGVAEVAIMAVEGLIYIKIDKNISNRLQLRQSLEKSKLIVLPLPPEKKPVEGAEQNSISPTVVSRRRESLQS